MTAPDTTKTPSADPSIHAEIIAGLLSAVADMAAHQGHTLARQQVLRLRDKLHGVQPAAPRPAPRLPTADEDAARAELLLPSVTPERRAALGALLVGAPDPAAGANAHQRGVLDEG